MSASKSYLGPAKSYSETMRLASDNSKFVSCNDEIEKHTTRHEMTSLKIQSFAQFRTFAQFQIIQIEEYLILLNDSACEFKLLSDKVHSLTDILI